MRQTSCAMNAYQSSCACTLSEPIEPPGGPARHRAYLIRVQNHFIKFGSAAVVNCSRERGGVKLRRLAANQVLSFTLPFEAKSHRRAPPSAPSLAGFAHFSVGDFAFSGPALLIARFRSGAKVRLPLPPLLWGSWWCRGRAPPQVHEPGGGVRGSPSLC